MYCVRVYACMCACVYVWMYVHVCVYVCTSVYACLWLYMYACVRVVMTQANTLRNKPEVTEIYARVVYNKNLKLFLGIYFLRFITGILLC